MQKISEWNPFPRENIHRLYCEGIHDDYEGFRILLSGEKEESSMLRLTFENTLLYQNRDESYLLNYPNTEGEFHFPHPFYIIDSSDLIKKFHAESFSIYSDLEIKHYAVYSCNDCIDVLSVEEPKADKL